MMKLGLGETCWLAQVTQWADGRASVWTQLFFKGMHVFPRVPLVNRFISLVIKKKIHSWKSPQCQALCLVPVKQRLIKCGIIPTYRQIRYAGSGQMFIAQQWALGQRHMMSSGTLEHLPRMVDAKESILVGDAGAVVLPCTAAIEKKWVFGFF